MTQANALPWLPIQGVIWVVGLVILAWQGWWLPGLLILIAVSAVAQAALIYDARRRTAQIDKAGKRLLPHNCPSCAGTLSVDDVRWTSSVAASCPYCGAQVEITDDPAKLVR